MSLPSQSFRPVASRAHMYRRARMKRGPRRLLLLAVLIGLGVAGFIIYPALSERLRSESAGAESERIAAASGSRSAERTSDAPSPPVASAREPHGESPRTVTSAPPLARDEAGLTQEPRRGGDTGPAASAPRPPHSGAESAARSEAQRDALRAPSPDRESAPSREVQRELERVARGREEIARNQPVEGRRTLSQALRSNVLPPQVMTEVMQDLARINERLIFSPEIVDGDPYTLAYRVEPGDALSRLPRKLGVQIDWRFIQRINGIRSPSSIAVNRRLKVVTGPFHAVVHKRDFRLDLWLGDEQDPVFVRSFRVGLGADDGTPEGRFRVRPGSKLINPEWINPRTRERFLPDDPMNPIGEHWIGLVGDEPHLVGVEGYGLHGTIEPDSIGTQSSMGCIRMLADDIALIYEVLTEPSSIITIRR